MLLLGTLHTDLVQSSLIGEDRDVSVKAGAA